MSRRGAIAFRAALLMALFPLPWSGHAHDTDFRPRILAPGDGEALEYTDRRRMLLKSTAEANGARELFAGTEHLPAGTAIPVHSHDGYEEIIFVHAGQPILKLGERRVRAEPGTVMFIPPGTFHGVESATDSATTIFAVFPSTDFADFFRRVFQSPGKPLPRLNAQDWREIMARHRMRVPPKRPGGRDLPAGPGGEAERAAH